MDAVGALIPAAAVYQPNGAHRAVYDKSYAVFKKLYAANRAQFRALNG